MEDEEEVEDPGLENSPPNKVNVEEQSSATGESGNNPNQDTEEDETMTNVVLAKEVMMGRLVGPFITTSVGA